MKCYNYFNRCLHIKSGAPNRVWSVVFLGERKERDDVID